LLRCLALCACLLPASLARAEPPARPLTTEEAVALLARTPLAACEKAAGAVAADGTRNPAQLGCVFDQQGAPVDALLERAARKGPVGAFVTFQLSIEPDGTVSQVRVAEGSASVRAFEPELAAAIARFTFPAQAVPRWTGTHTLNFHSH
jgi:hypothetical protein